MISPDIRKKAVEAVIAGETVMAAATACGISHSTLYLFLREEGITPPPRAPRTPGFVPKEAVEAYLDGQPSMDVALEYGVSFHSVLRAVRAAGGEIRPRGQQTGGPPTRPRHPKAVLAVALLRQGGTPQEVGARLGLPVERVEALQRRYVCSPND